MNERYQPPLDREAADIQQHLVVGQPEVPAPTAPLAIDIATPSDDRLTLAALAYRSFRPAGRRKAIRQAWMAFTRTPIDPANP